MGIGPIWESSSLTPLTSLAGSKYVLWGFGVEVEIYYTNAGADHPKHRTQILRLVSRLRYKYPDTY